MTEHPTDLGLPHPPAWRILVGMTHTEPLERLRAALGTLVVGADDDAYDQARTPWNTAIDQRPLAVTLPRSADDVVRIVRAARESGLRILPQSTGHGAGALAGTDLSRTVIVSLRLMRGVTVDPERRTAHVLGGSQWHDVLEVAGAHGLTAMHGSAADVSVVGYALKGGVSFYGRAHGLAVNSVRTVRVVTADGALVTASAQENAELFWGLRGGSGAFGVVVSLDIDLLARPDVFAGMLLWDAAQASAVAQAWAAWTATVPESTTTTMRVMHFPPIPELPPFLSGRSVVVVDGAILEADADAHALLAPLRALGPEVDTFGRIPAAALAAVHMDPPEPSPATSGHAMLPDLPTPAVDAFVHAAMTARPMISELRHCGGALGRRPEHAGAIGALEGDYLLSTIAIVPAPELAGAMAAAARAVVDALSPWHLDTLALTFVDDATTDVRGGYGDAAPRLARLKAVHDPDGVCVSSHPVPVG